MQLYTSASDFKGVENIPGNYSVKASSALPSCSECCQEHHKNAIPLILISVKEKGKNQLEEGQEGMGDAPILSHCSLLRNH